ncbi:T9SS type A sorting domain-containing protein [bacterium]|nr:T9SS type A sorting domain-containing protein [bacterium]
MIKNTFKKKILRWALLLILVSATSSVHALTLNKFSLNSFVHFGSGVNNFFKGIPLHSTSVNLNNKTENIELLRVGFSSVGQSMSEITRGNTADSEDDTIKAEVLGDALTFPNPFKQSTGTTLGYRLSKHMDIEIRIFNMLASQVFKGNYLSGTEGGKSGYNKLTLNSSSLNGLSLPAGVYFFIIMNDDDVLARGKMAVIP